MIKNVPLFFAFCLLPVLISCKKKEPDCGSCSSGEGLKPPPGLSFVVNGSNTTLLADSAWFIPVSKTIMAYYQGNAHKLVIKTSLQSPGTYSVSALNKVTYTETLLTYTATSGEIKITENTGTSLSGDFLTQGNSGGGITSLKGSFTELPKR
jgi:hypothetical protein